MKFVAIVRRGCLATLAAGAGIASAVAGTASAAPASPAAPAAVKMVTHHYSLAASAFAPDELAVSAPDYFNQWDPPNLSEPTGQRCFSTGLSLPNGVTLKLATVYYIQGSSPLRFTLVRQNLTDHKATDLVKLDSTASTTATYGSTTMPVAAQNAAVDYSKYAYSAQACPSGNTTFSGLTITYTQPASASAGPVKTVTHHYSLPASALSPDGVHDTANDYFNAWFPAELSNTDSGRCFDAGLSLPNGVTIKSVTAYYTQGTDGLFFEINRQDLINHTFASLVGYHTTPGATPGYTSASKPVAATVAAVDYTKYAYSVGVCPDGGTTYSGLNITYTQTVG